VVRFHPLAPRHTLCGFLAGRDAVSRAKLMASTHRLFDAIHEEGLISRAEAYQHLARALNKTSSQVHFGRLVPFELLVARKVVKRIRAQHRRSMREKMRRATPPTEDQPR